MFQTTGFVSLYINHPLGILSFLLFLIKLTVLARGQIHHPHSRTNVDDG
jgi:hypothetical protein